MKLIKRFSAAAAIGLCLTASGAHAVPVVLQDNNVAYRILNLEVGDTVYNIDFEYAAWPDVYGGPAPVFDFATPELAQEANEKINLALNGADVKQVGPPQEQQANEGFPLYAIGVAFDDPYVNWIGAAFVDNIDLWIDDFLGNQIEGSQDAESIWMWASATEVSEIPVPAAVWLFGSGLLGLMGVAKRKTA